MTTATDWTVRDAANNDEVRVTDVQAAIASATADDRTDRERKLEAMVEKLGTENAELRERLGMWRPRRDVSAITGAADLTEGQQGTALVAPTAEDLAETDGYGMPLTPILATYDWPTWLGDVHHADKAVAQAVTDLRAWPEQYAARSVERTIVEPVAVDYSYRDTEAWALAEMVRGQSSQHSPDYGGHVYDEDTGFVSIEVDAVPDDRIDRMISDPETYFAEARERAAQGSPSDREGLVRLAGRVKTAISTPPTRRVAAQASTYNETAEKLEVEPDGWVPATRWARALARISGRKRGL